MRLLIHGLNFSPELTGIGKYTGEMAAFFAAQGHEVRVVTAPPYYPEWRVHAGYRSWWWKKERSPNLTVYRAPLWVPKKPSGPKRLLHLASFALSSFPVMLRQVFWRPQVVMVVMPSFFNLPAAFWVAKICGARSWLHIQDFEIDAAVGLGMVPRRSLLALSASRMERFWLARFAKISTISDGMMRRLLQKGMLPERTFLFPNWVDVDLIKPLAQTSPYRREWGLRPGQILVLYSGNLGKKQGLETLLDAAARLRPDKRIQFVICGDGASKAQVEAACRLHGNIRLIPLQPLDRLNELLNAADIHALPQRADAADLVMPSKLGGMLASGRATVATAHDGTELARVIDRAGMRTPPGDVDALTNAFKALSIDPKLRKRLGDLGRRYAVTHWRKQDILSSLEKTLIGWTLG
jgi:colanic acid biosynthesis glycosyl transferase WcaI